MESRIAELRDKEVIDVSDGSRFGYVGDVEVDLETGKIRSLVVPGRLRLFGLLGREEDRLFPWKQCAASERTSSWWRPAGRPAGRPEGKNTEDRKKVLRSAGSYGKILKLCENVQYYTHRGMGRPVPARVAAAR